MTAEKIMALLPCPFCGGPAGFEECAQGSSVAPTSCTWTVGCMSEDADCIAYQMMATFNRRCEAAKAWNTRASAVGAGAPPGSDRMKRARALYLAVYESQGANWEANDCKELWCDKADRYLALTEPDGDTIQILLDLLNPLHGEIDRQLPPQFTDEREWDASDDREYNVNITARMERDLTQAVLILENRRSALPVRPEAPAGVRLTERAVHNIIAETIQLEGLGWNSLRKAAREIIALALTQQGDDK